MPLSDCQALRRIKSPAIIATPDGILDAIPFAVIEVHPDNGSEFINRNLLEYCTTRGIAMTRSQSGRKNDNCYVEQKNLDAVRKLIGYARCSGDLAAEQINDLRSARFSYEATRGAALRQD